MTTSHAHHDAAAPRYDIYAFIHKALRLLMTDTLTGIGRTDPSSDVEVQATLERVGRLLDLCETHLNSENGFVHPAMERVAPGSCARVAEEHREHEEQLADLRDLADLVRDRDGAARASALARLYHAVALMVAHNLEHMHFEETEHNRVLQTHYSDAEIHAIEQSIVGHLTPERKALAMHWFIPALNARERVTLLSGMRQAMPAPAFDGILEIARSVLAPADHARLLRSLGIEQPELVAA